MTEDRTRRVRLDDVAGGHGEPGTGEMGGRGALLLHIDGDGRVTAAAARGVSLHELVAAELEVYALSDGAAAGLVAAVQAVAGQAVWAQEPGQGHDGGGGEGPALTAREWEVLRLVAGGLTSEAVAGELGIRERTVRYHLTRIYGKIGASGRAEAIAWAVRRGPA